MAIQLNLQSIFSTPFSSKTFSLGGIADRAIPLVAVLPIKLMTLLAVSFASVKRGNGDAILERVFANRDGLEVLRVNTGSIAADVIYDQSVTNLTVRKEPSHAMGAPALPTKVKRAVSVSIKRGLPNVALSLHRPFLVESFDLSHNASLMVPKATRYKRDRQYALG